VANITMDADGVETVTLPTLGGVDNITVNSLVGTAVTQVNVDLAGIAGTTNGDAQADTVIVNGTSGPDIFNVAANGTAVEVPSAGVGALVHVTNAELANDRIAFTGVGGDTVNVNGSPFADTMQILPSPVAGYARVIVSGFTAPVDVTGALTLAVNGLGGTDAIVGANGLASLNIPIVLDGGDDDDTITGGDEADVIVGGAGNDVISGGRGNDVVFLGDGNDTFIWNPGDGSDTVEGGIGYDTLQFNCSNVGEHLDLSANGLRFRLFRDVGNVTVDEDSMETVNLPMLVDLASTLGGVNGDGQADTVIVNGTASPDTISIAANAGAVDVSGLATQVHIAHPEVANDLLIVQGLGGTDSISTGPGVTNLIRVTVNQ
jgi:Ca2+-binding RTX toxin-like protein